jgi:hypothetical protein
MLAMHPLATRPLAGGGGDLELKIPVHLKFNLGQSVAIRSGFFLAIGQENRLRIGAGLNLSIGQGISLKTKQRLLNIGQYYLNTQKSYQFDSNRNETIGLDGDFDVVVRIDGNDICACKLVEEISITRGENQASTCNLVLLEERGPIDLLKWLSKRIEVDIVSSKETVRIYTGTVDSTDTRFMTYRTAIQCSDNRERQNNALARSVVESIGYTCETVHGEFHDQSDEVVKRLSTVPASFEYDPMGIGYLTPWQPKTIADMVLDACEVYRTDISLKSLERGSVINKVKITIDVNYHLLRQREISQSFYSNLGVCDYARWGLPPKVESIRNASAGTGWAVGNMNITGLEPAGIYYCTGLNLWPYTLMWNPVSRRKTGETYKKDKDGKDVTDKDGNKVVDVTSIESQDFTMQYARSCLWDMSKRWVQGVTDRYEITLFNSPSFLAYEESETTLQASISPLDEKNEWGKDYKEIEQAPKDFVQIKDGDAYKEIARNSEEATKVRLVLINAGYTTMMSSHRNNTLTLETRFMPKVDTRHTHELDLPMFKGNAKVATLSHTLDLVNKKCTSEITYKFFINKSGDGGGLPIIMAKRPSKKFTDFKKQQQPLGTHLVLFDQDVEKSTEDFYGFIQKATDASNLGSIGVKFKVASADVDEKETDANIFKQEEKYDIAIPNNPIRIFI